MAKDKVKIKIDKPKIRKDWGTVKPYTKIHGSTKYEREDEKEEIEKAVDEALDEKPKPRKGPKS